MERKGRERERRERVKSGSGVMRRKGERGRGEIRMRSIITIINSH